MQEGKVLPAAQINRDLLRSILETPRWFWPVVSLLGLIVLAAAITIGIMINTGLGITGVELQGGVGLLHHQLRVLDRYQPRRRDALRHPAPGQGRVASPGNPRRRGADHFLADDGDDYAHHPHGPPLAHPVLGLPLRLRPRHLAQHPHPVGLGSVRDSYLPHVIHLVRNHRAGSRLRRAA